MINLTKFQIITVALIVILGFSSALFALGWYGKSQELKLLKEKTETNEKIVSFISLFINNIYGEGQEVSFEERLKMENAVRDINNKDILDQWASFTASKTQDESQANAKTLFNKLVNSLE